MHEVKAESLIEGPTPSESPAPVVVVVVHGIGDQVCNATVQQVVTQFSHYYDADEPVSLGSFDPGPFKRKFKVRDGTERTFRFSEVYWADVPRRVATQGYTLEETKQWASIIVERLKPLEKKAQPHGFEVNYPLVQQVVAEMVETISVLERLTFLADKAGLVKFDLNKVLVDYLDDVQLVAEFQPKRDEILAKFAGVLEKVPAGAEIYIVAHSEGTVVSFLGLVNAMWAKETPPWLKQVRGFLTIGSPIDKHLVLWPELFPNGSSPKFNPPAPQSPGHPDLRIKWRNYYDYGDPVGFELDFARKWLRDHQLTAFEFVGREEHPKDAKGKEYDPQHDIGFARYYLPGKAHNDYWTDRDVFGHFIEAVVDKSPSPRKIASKKGVWPVAYLAAYGLPFLLLMAAVFFILRSVASFAMATVADLDGTVPGGLYLVRDAAGIACLLAGMTVLARMPRLASPRLSFKWQWIALGIFALLAAAYWGLTGEYTVTAMNKLPLLLGRLIHRPAPGLDTLKWYSIATGFVISAGSAWLGRKFVGSFRGAFSAGSKPLILAGGITAVGMVLALLIKEGKGTGDPSLWPVLLSLAGFLYLWWLAILIFDLVFVWHRYVRHGVANERMERSATQIQNKGR